jgi:hypothetical protein
MPSRFKVNFRNYKIVKVGGFAFGVRVNAINSSTQTKLDNRIKLNIDITKLVSVGGFNIVDYPDLLKDFRYPDINKYLIAEWGGSSSNTILGGSANYSIGLLVELSDFTESQSIPGADIGVNYKDNSAFKDAVQDYEIDINIETEIDMAVNIPDGDFSITGEFRFIVTSSGGSIIKNELITSGSIDEINKVFSTTAIDTRTETINAGESWGYFFIVIKNSGNDQEYELDFASDLNASSGVEASTATLVEGFPVYEGGERLCQHILDSQFPFYSEFLGRLDTPYNLNGDVYLSENQLRFASIMSGLNLRGETLSDINNPLTISFTKYFKSIKAWWNVGYQLEIIDGFERIRFENYDFFFDDSEEFDLSNRINTYDIVSEAMPELAYLSLISGYKEFDYEATNGRGEYNSKNERSSIIATDSVFDNVSDFRGDTRGVTLQLERSVTEDGTKDEKEDNKIFMVKSQRSAVEGEDWKAETDENITIENDTSLFREGSLNLYSTPTRNLVRNSNRITSAYQKMLSSKLRFQTSGKLQTLETTGEGYTVIENEDLVVNNLNAPIYKAIKHTVEVQFDFDDLEAIRGKLIRFTSDLTGFLLNLKKKNNEDKATITIIEKYV